MLSTLPKQKLSIYEWFSWSYSLSLALEKYKKALLYILLVQQFMTDQFLLYLPLTQSGFFTLIYISVKIDIGRYMGAWGGGGKQQNGTSAS